MRLFWACTHTMLRITEIPMFKAAGLEVIPEEVTASVLTYLEGLTYDDPALPINQLWRENITIPENVLLSLRRSRLWDRNGQLSQAEIDLFNQYIHVMYVPTRIDLAIAISQWFKGTVLFRFFGDLPAGKEELEATQSVPSNMVYVPIFKSLLTHRIAKLFKKSFVLHNYLNTDVVTAKWPGVVVENPATIVLGDVANSIEAQDTLRALFPLAKKIPIKLLGKNIASLIPADIKKHYEIKTNLPRDRFFAEFFASQFLIYPHSNPFHSHNVPIEAVYGGMPLVFRIQTPTYIENTHTAAIDQSPRLLGAAESNAQLIDIAQRIYGDETELLRLQEMQRYLTTPYQQAVVMEECRELVAYLQQTSQPQTELAHHPENLTAWGHIPLVDHFKSQTDVVNDHFKMPLAVFAMRGNSINQLVSFTHQENPLFCLRLPIQQATFFNLGWVSGGEPRFFAPFQWHEISIDFYSLGGEGALHCSAMQVVGEAYQAFQAIRKHFFESRGCSTPQVIKIAFYSKKPFRIRLLLETFGNAEILAGHLKHTVLTQAPADLRTQHESMIQHGFFAKEISFYLKMYRARIWWKISKYLPKSLKGAIKNSLKKYMPKNIIRTLRALSPQWF